MGFDYDESLRIISLLPRGVFRIESFMRNIFGSNRSEFVSHATREFQETPLNVLT